MGVDDHHRHVRLCEQDEVTCDLFVDRRRHQRIRARQIDQFVACLAQREGTLGAGDRLAGPVAGVLS